MPYGSLVVKLAMDMVEFQRDLGKTATVISRDLNRALNATKTALGALGAGLAVRGLANIAKASIDAQDSMYKMSQRVGVAVESLSALNFAAQLSDVSFEALGSSLAKLNKAMAETQTGTGEAQGAFKALGISVTDATGNLRLTEDVFGDIAEAFANMEDGAGKTALAMKIFGRSGAELIPLLNQGREGLKAAGDEARRLGVLLDGESAAAAERFNDNLTRLEITLKGVRDNIIIGLVPVLDDLVNSFKETSVESEKWRDIGRDIGEVMKAIAVGAIYATGFIQSLGKTIGGLSAAAAALASGDLAGAGGIVREVKSDNDRLDDELRKRREFINALGGEDGKLRRDLNALGDVGGGRPKKKAAPAIVDENAAKKAIDAQRKLADAAEQLANSRAKTLAASEQALADTRLKILDRFYAEGLVSEEEYWNNRLELQQAAIRAQITASEQEIASAQRALAAAEARAGKDVEGATDYLKALKTLEEAQAKRNELEIKFGQVGVDVWLDKQKGAEAYKDAVADLNAQILELQGRTAEAGAIRLDRQTRGIRIEATRNKDTRTLEDIAKFERLTQAQQKYTAAQQRSELLTGNLALAEERIRNSREVGAISEIRALAQTGDARKDALGQLQAIASEMENIASEAENPFLVQQAAAFRLEVEKLAMQTDLLGQKFDQIGESAFADFLTEAISDVRNFEQAFKKMIDSIVNQINRLASEEISRQLVGALGIGPQRGGASGFGSFFSSLFSGNLFGGGGSGLAVDALLATGGAGIPAFLADGGKAKAGHPYIVGDGGEPELFVPDVSGNVIPFSRMGGGTTIVNNFSFAQPPDRRTQAQVATMAAIGANRAMRRNG